MGLDWNDKRLQSGIAHVLLYDKILMLRNWQMLGSIRTH